MTACYYFPLFLTLILVPVFFVFCRAFAVNRLATFAGSVTLTLAPGLPATLHSLLESEPADTSGVTDTLRRQLAYLESLKNTVEACRRYQVRKIPAPSRKVREALLLALR